MTLSKADEELWKKLSHVVKSTGYLDDEYLYRVRDAFEHMRLLEEARELNKNLFCLLLADPQVVCDRMKDISKKLHDLYESEREHRARMARDD